ncbi:MAG TPA: hypothetical protein PKA50_10495 [Gemmatimonadales bacterium]|nr:hypothetical protein [Gemmatimonadales bacterium]
MNAINSIFRRPRVLLPVVHCCDPAQAAQQADLARESGADGVFFINQGGMSGAQVARLAREYGLANRGWFVGVNLLGVVDSFKASTLIGSCISGLWDDAWSDGPLNWSGAYFGGVAFKYQRPEVPPEKWGEAARAARDAGVAVVTTSGPATGEPAPVEKARAMRDALGHHALALASGITPENVGDFLPYVDAYLVATGIERSFGEFDASRLRALAEQIHTWRA